MERRRKKEGHGEQPPWQAAVERRQRTPVGTVNVVDPNLFNWLFITGSTVEEPVCTDERGHIVGAVMRDFRWIDDTTFELAETEVDEEHWSRRQGG